MRKLTVVLLALVLILAAAGAMAARESLHYEKSNQVYSLGFTHLTRDGGELKAYDLPDGRSLIVAKIITRNDKGQSVRLDFSDMIVTSEEHMKTGKIGKASWGSWMLYRSQAEKDPELLEGYDTYFTATDSVGQTIASGETVTLYYTGVAKIASLDNARFLLLDSTSIVQNN